MVNEIKSIADRLKNGNREDKMVSVVLLILIAAILDGSLESLVAIVHGHARGQLAKYN